MHLFYSGSPSGHSFSFRTVVCSNDEHPSAWFEGTQGRRKALYLKNTENIVIDLRSHVMLSSEYAGGLYHRIINMETEK